MAKRDYAVGRGKPPAASQFKKGQSGNPGGKPGPTKTFQRELRETLDEALAMPSWDLKMTIPQTAIDEVAKELVLGAVRGKAHAVKTLLALTDKYAEADSKAAPNEKNSTQEPTSAGGVLNGETHRVTLSQGNSQGNFESQPVVEAISQPDQQVDASLEPSSGNISGTDAPSPDEPPPVAPRPKRPTITIAGEVVQQGD